jgi:hypothetical protein
LAKTTSLINEMPPAASGEFLQVSGVADTMMAALVFQKSVSNFFVYEHSIHAGSFSLSASRGLARTERMLESHSW